MNEKKKMDMINAASWIPMGFLCGGPAGAILLGITTAIVGKIDDNEVAREAAAKKAWDEKVKKQAEEDHIREMNHRKATYEAYDRIWEKVKDLKHNIYKFDRYEIDYNIYHSNRHILHPEVNNVPIILYDDFRKVTGNGIMMKSIEFEKKIIQLQGERGFKFIKICGDIHSGCDCPGIQYAVTVDDAYYYFWWRA